MTIGEIVAQACTMLGRSDSASLDFARASVRKWNRVLWDRSTWRETQALVYTKAQGATMILPPQFERITHLRHGADSAPPVFELGTFFQLDPASFERDGGEAIGFAELPPVATRVSPAGQPLTIQPVAAVDSGVVLIVKGERNGEPIFESVTLPTAPATITTANAFDLVNSISKPVTTGGVVVISAGTGADLCRLQPYETTRRHCRILITEQMANETDILILGKKCCPPIMGDSDVASLSNIDDALLDFVRSDLYERDRRGGMAAQAAAKAGALIDIRSDLERAQSAAAPRLIPFAEPAPWLSEHSLFP